MPRKAIIAAFALGACATGVPDAPWARGVEGDFTGPDAIGMALIGTWTSRDDPLSVLDIDFGPEGHVAAMGYDGALNAGEPLRFVTDCDARAASDAASGAFVIGAETDARCYHVLSLTPDALVLSYAARGNTLRYVREA